MRIAGELDKLGVAISAMTVRKVLRSHGLRPSPRQSGPTWEQFFRAQANGILATDFFGVDSVFGSRLYIRFVIELESRDVHLLGVTKRPADAWVTQVARNFTADLEEAGRQRRFLVRDRDTKFTRSFDAVLSAVGIETLKTPVRSPRAYSFAERFVRTARSECLDLVIILGQRHLERVVREFVGHYDAERPHRGLNLATPIARAPPSTGRRGARPERRPLRRHPRLRVGRLKRDRRVGDHGSGSGPHFGSAPPMRAGIAGPEPPCPALRAPVDRTDRRASLPSTSTNSPPFIAG